MKVEHTPGPWRAIGTEYGDFEVIAVEEKPSIGRIVIAEHVAQGVYDGKEDAYLIAAAPDLLKSLEDILQIIKPGDKTGWYNSEWHQAEAAIKKARGQ